MKTLALLAILSVSTGRLVAVPAPPVLTIRWVTQINSPLTLSPLGVASVPVIVDLRTGINFVPADGCQFAVTVVCSNEPVLAVEVTAQNGHTNEVEWSTDLIRWTPSNVRWVSDGQTTRYFITQAVGSQFYRVKEWNSPPVANIVVFPLTGGLSSLLTSGEAEPPTPANWVVISPNGTSAEVVLQGSQSGDVDNDPLQHVWEVDGNLLSPAANAIKRFPLGQSMITLKVSDGIVDNAVSVAVETIKASAAVERLMAAVSLDKDANKLRPLVATLRAAAASFERNDIVSGVNQLESFKKKLLKLQASGQQILARTGSPDETGTKLLQATGEIIHAVTNPETATNLPLSAINGAGQTVATNQTGIMIPVDAFGSTDANEEASSQSGSSGATVQAGCSWSAGTSQTWIHTTSNGSGNGKASYLVDANSSTSSRSGTITVGGQSFAVNQAGGIACGVVLSPISASFSAAVSSGSFGVTASAGCSWSATPDQVWIHTTSSGKGNGTVSYTLDANGGKDPRSGTISVNGQTFGVSQAGATTVDGEAPTATFLAPPLGAVLQGQVSVQARLTDNVSLARAEFYVDNVAQWLSIGVSPASGTLSTNTVMFDSTLVGNGSHTLMCVVYDTAGNSSYTLLGVSVTNIITDPGNALWLEEIARPTTTGGEAIGNAVKADAQGNIVVVGNIRGTVNFGSVTKTSLGGTDVFIAKYSPGGNLLWVRTYGGTSDDSGNAVALDASGNILVTGYFFGTANFGGDPITSGDGIFGSDIFVAKYSSTGAHLWSKRFGGRFGNNLGAGIAVDSTGNVLVGGKIYIEADLGNGLITTRAGSADGFVLKLQGQTGGYLWARNFGSIDSDVVRAVAVDSLGDVVVVGYAYAGIDFGGGLVLNAGSGDLFIVKYAGVDGHYLWSLAAGGSGPDSAEGVAVDANQNIFVTGGFTRALNLGGIYVAASIETGIYLAKYNPSGVIQWARGISYETANGGIDVRSAAVDSSGNVTIAGTASGGVNFGGGFRTDGESNIYVAKYRSDNRYLWAKRSSNSGRCAGFSVATDGSRNVLTTGFIQGDVNIDGLTASSPGTTIKSAFLLKVSP